MTNTYMRLALLACLVLLNDAIANAQPMAGELYLIKVNGRVGYIDKTGRVVIKPRFNAPGTMYDRHDADSVWFADGCAPVLVNGKWGYIDRSGRIRIKPRFSIAASFVDGLASACVPDVERPGYSKCGVINTAGKYVIKPIYDDQLHFSEGLARIEIRDEDGDVKTGFIDASGRMAIEPQANLAWSFSDGLAKLQMVSNGIYEADGFIDKTGQLALVLKDKHSATGRFSEGLLAFFKYDVAANLVRAGRDYDFDVMTGKNASETREFNAVGYLDKTGKVAIQPQYEHGRDFHEGLAAIYVGGVWGFINTTGKVVIAPRFEYVGDFAEGLAAVCQEGKCGFIDKTGEVVIEMRFAAVGNFRGGIAAISDDVQPPCLTCQLIVTKWRTLGYINISGEYVWRPSK